MSFLTELMSKRNKLKPTTTTITYPDGTRKKYNSLQGIEETDCSASRCYGFVIDTKPDPIPACILPDFLYLGSQDAVTDTNIDTFGFTDIISVGIETPAIDANPSRQIAKHFIPCLDLPETKLIDFVNQAISILSILRNERPKRSALVHCNAGVSRSATVCIAYLIKIEGMTFTMAYELVKAKRECIRPNDGFLKQLKEMDAI